MLITPEDNITPSEETKLLPGDSKAWYWGVWVACFLLLMFARKVEPGHDDRHHISSQEYSKPCELLFAKEDRIVFFDHDNDVPHLMSMSETGAVASYAVPVPKGGDAHPRLVSGDTRSNLIAAVEEQGAAVRLVVWRMETSDVCWTKKLSNCKVNSLLWCGNESERHLLVFGASSVEKDKAQLLGFKFPALVTYGDNESSTPRSSPQSSPQSSMLKNWPGQNSDVYRLENINHARWLWDGPPILMLHSSSQNTSRDGINVLIRLRQEDRKNTFALGWLHLDLQSHAVELKRAYLDVCPNSYAWALDGNLIAATLPVKKREADLAVKKAKTPPDKVKTPSDLVFWPREASEVNPHTMISGGFNGNDSRVIGSLEGRDDRGHPYPSMLLIETSMEYAGYNLWVMTLSSPNTHPLVRSLHEITYRLDIQGPAIATFNNETLQVVLVNQANSPTSHKSVCTVNIVIFNKASIVNLTKAGMGLKRGLIAECLEWCSKKLPSALQQTFCVYFIFIGLPGYGVIRLLRRFFKRYREKQNSAAAPN